MEINTYSYIQVYGKEPRGKSTWYFSPGDNAGHIYSEYVYSVDMTYASAKKWAKEHFSGYPVVYLLP
jgi:hypothetical protein